jgi:hypothetical protein
MNSAELINSLVTTAAATLTYLIMEMQPSERKLLASKILWHGARAVRVTSERIDMSAMMLAHSMEGFANKIDHYRQELI